LDRLATAVIVFGERGGSFPVSIAAFTSRGMHSLHRMAHGDGRRDRLVSSVATAWLGLAWLGWSWLGLMWLNNLVIVAENAYFEQYII